MNRRPGDDKFEETKKKPQSADESAMPEIRDEDLDKVSGGGNSAWGTMQQPPGGANS
jgi:hypothetical protein